MADEANAYGILQLRLPPGSEAWLKDLLASRGLSLHRVEPIGGIPTYGIGITTAGIAWPNFWPLPATMCATCGGGRVAGEVHECAVTATVLDEPGALEDIQVARAALDRGDYVKGAEAVRGLRPRREDGSG